MVAETLDSREGLTMKQSCFRHFVTGALLLATGAVTTSTSSIAAAPPGERVEGMLLVVWGDPQAGSPGGGIRFSLALPDGRTVPLQISPNQRNSAIRNFGKSVVVQGRKITAADGRQVIAVSRMLPGIHGSLPEVKPALATKTALFILLRYKDDSQQPHKTDFYLALTNPKVGNKGLGIPASINGFFSKTSWNQLQWHAEVAGVGGLNPITWLTLPFPKSHYANCTFKSACADVFSIAADGMALAAKAGVAVTTYDAVNFVMNDDMDCCSWGGSFVYLNHVYHGTWEAPWGQDASYYAHEMGHALGLPHSGWVYYAYDSPWDIMSMHAAVQQTKCGSYNSANNGGRLTDLLCWAPGDGYIGAHKDWLGWIPAANEVVINTVTTKTVTLEANAWPLKTAVKLIKVCLAGAECTGARAHYITVEARMHGKAYEKGEPGDGVLIQDFQADRNPIGGGCFFLNQSGWVVPVDATPGDYDSRTCSGGSRKWPNYALGNAEYGVGDRYVNAAHHVSVDVLSKNGATYSVRVARSQ
jgi:hypothetical protein